MEKEKLNLSLQTNHLMSYVNNLLNHYLPDHKTTKSLLNVNAFELALDRVEFCFSHIHRKYYTDKEKIIFDHLNGDHMAIFLYLYSNTHWKMYGDSEIPTRIFYLNKIMHGLDLFYSVAMPDIFLLIHPLGTVLGHASYKDFLVVYQNCTIGSIGSDYPSLGEGVVLYSKSSALGKCKIGDNVVFGAGAMVINCEVPSNTIILGQHPHVRLVQNKITGRSRFFDKQISRS